MRKRKRVIRGWARYKKASGLAELLCVAQAFSSPQPATPIGSPTKCQRQSRGNRWRMRSKWALLISILSWWEGGRDCAGPVARIRGSAVSSDKGLMRQEPQIVKANRHSRCQCQSSPKSSSSIVAQRVMKKKRKHTQGFWLMMVTICEIHLFSCQLFVNLFGSSTFIIIVFLRYGILFDLSSCCDFQPFDVWHGVVEPFLFLHYVSLKKILLNLEGRWNKILQEIDPTILSDAYLINMFVIRWTHDLHINIL